MTWGKWLLLGTISGALLFTGCGSTSSAAPASSAVQLQLAVQISGSGSGTVTSNPAGINCGTTCGAAFSSGSQVTLTPAAQAGSGFAGWSGACSGTASCVVTVTSNSPVTATFSPSVPTASSPVAFVYVPSSSGTDSYEVNAFAAGLNGRLIPVAGSPFAANVSNLAANGKYLFGVQGAADIDSFSISPTGAIAQTSSINAQQFNQNDCGGPVGLFFDRTGATLYDQDFYSDCANNSYQSFSVGSSNGGLNYVGLANAASPAFQSNLSFIGNNQYAYAGSCYVLSGPLIYGFIRNSDGTLTDLNLNTPIPAGSSGNSYCPGAFAADPTNHLAVVLQTTTSDYPPTADGSPQLAVYAADEAGNLSTNSTSSNMPAASVGYYPALALSPAANLLAVAGTGGLQVFHFNGGNPITRYTGQLLKDEVDQVVWDNNNHLYALSIAGNSAGKLFVFTITPTGVAPAPGSPYTITKPQSIAVSPRRSPAA